MISVMKSLVWGLCLTGLSLSVQAQDDILVLGGEGNHCGEDPHCINRLHPEIPMAAEAAPGQTIVLHARNASDFDLDPDSTYDDPRELTNAIGTVHPLTGPVHIRGAEAGDAIAVRLLDVAPGEYGYTSISFIGWVSDVIEGPLRVLWRLNRDYAETDDIPGVRIPYAAFPGVVTTLPGGERFQHMLAREAELEAAGGAVFEPNPRYASPADVCGEGGSHTDTCLRTLPPREHGGNMDIRYMQKGATIYLPCYVDGCGLAMGDPHYAQGDGEVAGTAIEMDATFTVTVDVIKGGAEHITGPQFEGPARLMDIPSRHFYATTGYPVKEAGTVPPNMDYLGSELMARLENLDKDLNVAARNALLTMIDHMVRTYDLTPEQAYIIASVAVDLRIGQLVDSPNVGAVAVLPTDIFTGGR